MYRQMAAIAGRYDLSSLRKCVSAGEALPDATRQAFKEATGIEIIDGIGSTEMIHIFISHTPERVRRGATGYAIPGYQATVLDEDGNGRAPGQVGRLAVKGRRAAATSPTTGKRTTSRTVERDRRRVSHGSRRLLLYQARTDDMIISAGYNIAGPEVEDALQASGGGRMRRGRRAGQRSRHHRQSLRPSETRQ